MTVYLLPKPVLECMREEPGRRPAYSAQQVLTDAIVLIQPYYHFASIRKASLTFDDVFMNFAVLHQFC